MKHISFRSVRFYVFLILPILLVSGFFYLKTPRQSIAASQVPANTKNIIVKRGNQSFLTNVIQEDIDPETGRAIRQGSIIVRFINSTTDSDEDSIHKKAGIIHSEKLQLKNTHRVDVEPNKYSQTLKFYRENPAVLSAAPDYIVRPFATPNDPSFSQQWGMTKINAPSAWDVTTSSPSTRIAVLDCGIYDSSSTYISPDGKPGHPDVRDKVISRINFTTSPNADDYCDHGTHVSGIAAANTNNGIGVAGASYNASLVNVKVLGDNGSGTFSWITNGILWAAGCDTSPCGVRRADIINMSLGATGSCDPVMQAAIDSAWNQGLIIVAAAGNNGSYGSSTPGNCNHVISVSASDSNDKLASFSNYGSNVDVAAPGVNIISSDYTGGYASFSGTSMASPHVAGLAALLWTTNYNTGDQSIVNRILQTANSSVFAGSLYGRIDAYNSVSGNTVISPTNTPSPTTIPVSSPTSTPIPVSLIPTPTTGVNNCVAPFILTHSDTNPNGGGIVSFSWLMIPGASKYRIERQRTDGTWSSRSNTSATTFTGSDGMNDPLWRISVSSGTCTPIPGPSAVFNP